MKTYTIPEFDLADRLRKTLREAGMSQGEMADYLGCARETVSSYVSGKTHPPRPVLMVWADRVDVPLYWLQNGRLPENGSIVVGDFSWNRRGDEDVRPEGFEPPTY